MVSSGAIMPARAPHSMLMLQTVMRPSMDMLLEHRAAVLDHVALAAAGAGLGDDGEDDVLRGDAVGQLAVDRHRHRLRAVHAAGSGWRARARPGWCRCRTRARRTRRGCEVCESPQTIVMPGWVMPELRADDVHDALLGVAHRVERDAELGAVAAQRLDLRAADRVGDRLGADQRQRVVGRHVVVLGGQREVGTAHRAPGEPQPVEGLRAGDLVDEVHVDVEQVGLARGRAHDVAVPELLGERLAHGRTSVSLLASHICETLVSLYGTA